MYESAVDFWVTLPSYEQSPEVSEPRDGAFDLPTSLVASQGPPVLEPGLNPIAFVRSNLFDARFRQSFSQGRAVVGLVRDQALRGSGRHGAQRFFDERDFRRARGVDGYSQRNTLAVCQYHKLCALAPLGFSDASAPFFAGANVPSTKVSLQSRWPRSSNSSRKARQTVNQTSCSIQRWRRRQQVLGLGYRSGKSCQRAPVRSTHKIPSRHARLSAQGRPRLVSLGKCGSIFSHCLFDKYSVRLMGNPPMNLYRQNKLTTL